MTDQQTCTTCEVVKPIESFRHYASGRIHRQCKGCCSAKTREWRQANVEKKRQNTKRDYANNTARYRAQNAAYRARKSKAMPKWLTDSQRKEIEQFYELARWYDEPMHVDHIVPLQGKDVCGLHVPWNLQILPAQENRIKHNSIGL